MYCQAVARGVNSILSDFQLIYEPKVGPCNMLQFTANAHFIDVHQLFKAERASWRAVIQLNVVRSIHLILGAMQHASSASSLEDSPDDLPELNPELWMIKMRLSPLMQVEQALTRRLTPLDSGETEPTHLDFSYERSKSVLRELAVNSATQWKSTFSRLLRVGSDGESFDSEDMVDWDDPNDPGLVLHTCSADMAKLWGDPTIHQLLEKQNIRLEEMAGL